jgi:hypothetical protein
MGQDFGSFGAVVCFVVFCVCGCGVVCFWGFWLVKLLKLRGSVKLCPIVCPVYAFPITVLIHCVVADLAQVLCLRLT